MKRLYQGSLVQVQLGPRTERHLRVAQVPFCALRSGRAQRACAGKPGLPRKRNFEIFKCLIFCYLFFANLALRSKPGLPHGAANRVCLMAQQTGRASWRSGFASGAFEPMLCEPFAYGLVIKLQAGVGKAHG